MRTITHHGITWHDDPAPSEEQLVSLQKEYGFHELDIEDCLSEQERPKVEEYESYLFLVFHIPYMNAATGRVLKEELNIFLGQDFIVTLHQGKIAILDELWTDLRESRKKREEYMQTGTGFFLYELMNQLFDSVFPLVDQISKQIRRIEDELFESEEEVDMLRDIMNVKRNTIALRSILLPQRTLVATLEHKNRKFIPQNLSLYFDDILDAIERQWSLLDTAKEIIDALQDTHESWLSHKTSAIVRVLTVFSVTMLPLSVITGLYGMNVHLPLQESPLAFLGVSLILLLLMLVMLVYYSRKHWL